jgi:hypothetical protein
MLSNVKRIHSQPVYRPGLSIAESPDGESVAASRWSEPLEWSTRTRLAPTETAPQSPSLPVGQKPRAPGGKFTLCAARRPEFGWDCPAPSHGHGPRTNRAMIAARGVAVAESLLRRSLTRQRARCATSRAGTPGDTGKAVGCAVGEGWGRGAWVPSSSTRPCLRLDFQ